MATRPKASKTHLILSCHLDLVPEMNGQQEWTVKGDRVTGTIDNLAGSAVVFSLLDELRQAGVEVHFTQREEIDLGEARKIARRLAGKKNTLVLVVDTANPHGKEEVIVGNDFRFDGIGLARRLSKEGFRVSHDTLDFGDEDNEDETWAYAKAGVPCVAIYVPANGDFHTSEAWTTAQRIAAVRRAILRTVELINEDEFCPEPKREEVS